MDIRQLINRKQDADEKLLSSFLSRIDGSLIIKMSKEEWRLLLESPNKLESLQRLIINRKIAFPYKRFSFNNINELFLYLTRYKTVISHKPYTLPNHKFSTRLFPFTLDGQYTSIITRDEDYERGDKLTDYFQEQERVKARRSDERESPYEYWTSGEHITQIFNLAIQKESKIDPHSLREALYELVKEATQFKPTLAISVLRFFDAKRVLDFSAGWGDRLLAAIAVGVEKYVGVDPNTALEYGHDAIISTFAPKEQVKTNTIEERYSVIYSPFQTVDLPSNQTYNLVFTSPPFFDFEIYTSLPGQSVQQHPTLDDWLVGFLFLSLQKAWNFLEVSGHLVIHISDVYKTRVTEAMNLFCQYKLQGTYYRGVLASYGGAQKPRPMWVWRKESATDFELAKQAEMDMQRFYPRLFTRLA